MRSSNADKCYLIYGHLARKYLSVRDRRDCSGQAVPRDDMSLDRVPNAMRTDAEIQASA